MSNRIQSNIHIAILSAFALAASIGSAASQSPPPAPKFQPAAGAVVSGLSGLVTATAGLSDYRSARRLLAFRKVLTEALKKPGLDLTKPITIAPSNEGILCTSRSDYATMAAQSAYITAVTTTLNQFATPPTITTIGQAFVSVFQNYQIDPTSGRMSVNPTAISAACQADIDKWPLASYGAPLAGPPKAGVGELLAAGAALSTFGTLLSDLNSIITPVATQTAQFIDAQHRQLKIQAFLTDPKIQKDLLAAANDLATNGNILITANRLQAVAVFEEKLSTVRTFKIDLSKIDACKTAMSAPALADENGVPTDAFVVCYAQAWAQLKDVITATIAAAAQYDALADASSDQLSNSVKAIEANIAELKNPTITPQQLLDAATQLITIGQSVQKALSPDNVTKLQKDAENVMNLFK